MLFLLAAIAAQTHVADCPYPSISRIEVVDGKTFEVFLAPACKNKSAKCKAWERDWPVNSKPAIGDVITPEGLVYREKPRA